MTIDEAIDILERRQDNTPQIGWERTRKANQMGIAALKRCKAYKEAHVGLHYEPLPGETEE